MLLLADGPKMTKDYFLPYASLVVVLVPPDTMLHFLDQTEMLLLAVDKLEKQKHQDIPR